LMGSSWSAAVAAALYRLSLHDALPISGSSLRANARPWAASSGAWAVSVIGAHCSRGRRGGSCPGALRGVGDAGRGAALLAPLPEDRKSTRLNSSHVKISYAVFCLKKKT